MLFYNGCHLFYSFNTKYVCLLQGDIRKYFYVYVIFKLAILVLCYYYYYY
jgi:hypothetical protein